MDETNDMMSCQEYQEKIAAEPAYTGGREHLSRCNACQAFHAEIQALDAEIARALALEVPALTLPELPAIDKQRVAHLARRRLMVPTGFAVAASVLLAVVLGFMMRGEEHRPGSLADQVVAHIAHEPFAMTVSDQSVSDERLARVMPASVSSLDSRAGLITYAQSCVINGRQVPHLVIQGAHGPVTILLMPSESIAAAEEIHDGSLNGVILPMGRGSVAIVGESEDDLKLIEKEVRDSVRWTT